MTVSAVAVRSAVPTLPPAIGAVRPGRGRRRTVAVDTDDCRDGSMVRNGRPVWADEREEKSGLATGRVRERHEIACFVGHPAADGVRGLRPSGRGGPCFAKVWD